MAGKRAMRKHAVASLEGWAPRFGFGHFVITADETPGKDKAAGQSAWAHVDWDVEEEWMMVWLSPDLESLTRAQVEHVMLHELFHVLFAFAKASDITEEMACNRMAGLLVGPQHGVRRASALDIMAALDTKAARQYFDEDERELLLEALPHLIVRMEPKHREVLCAIFYDGKSLGDLATEMDIPRTGGSGVQALRDQAIAALREMFLTEGGAQ